MNATEFVIMSQIGAALALGGCAVLALVVLVTIVAKYLMKD